MRQSARWMVLLDDRIMEFIDENGPSLPSNIADDDRIPYGSQHIGNRCRKLAEVGLLENLGTGVYVLTAEGKSYLEGERSVEETPESSEESEKGTNGV
ncbi:hypothetical protein SY89_02249 [Halolamina pelagica]|uniref:Uncharacterized protein n=2 Tax=Halolamina pelagica TaxID=699431 RepID=A0A0P7HD37_9EURY|nr:hypothetical protein SY89_02249 [Halolamina pelagica]